MIKRKPGRPRKEQPEINLVQKEEIKPHEEEKGPETEGELLVEEAKTKDSPMSNAEVKAIARKENPSFDSRIGESRKLLEQPLSPGQILYESPEGYIMVGEEGKGTIWCRHSNGGKGSWINPRR